MRFICWERRQGIPKILPPLFLGGVKQLREKTPYFRKTFEKHNKPRKTYQHPRREHLEALLPMAIFGGEF